MNDEKLWIDEVGCTATITGANVSYTMPLWVFEDMREIIVAEAEKKVEVTHRDFDIQQELLDRYRAENAKLRSQCADLVDERERLFRANVEKNGEILRLVGENAKLRELVHDLLQPILADGFDCYGCVHEDCDGMQYTDKCKLLDRARELGIEVNE